MVKKSIGEMKMKAIEYIRENCKWLLPAIVMFVIVVAMIAAVGFAAGNEANRISEGTVIEKDYSAGYTRYSGDGDSRTLISEPPRYYLLLRGGKNGETVKYWCEVTEGEYNSVKIGEFFRR